MEEKKLLKTKKKKGIIDYINRQIWMFIRIENLWHEFLVSNIFHNVSIIEQVQAKQIPHESFHSHLTKLQIHNVD